jgi:exosortase/archaeosortase family protein
MNAKKKAEWFTIYAITLAFLYTTFYVATHFLERTGFFYPLQKILSATVYFPVKLIHAQTTLKETILANIFFAGENIPTNISMDFLCLALIPTLTVFAMILSIPKISIKQKIFPAILAGAGIIFINYLRLIISITAGILFGEETFFLIHNTMYKTGFSILAIIIFVIITHFFLKEKIMKTQKEN